MDNDQYNGKVLSARIKQMAALVSVVILKVILPTATLTQEDKTVKFDYLASSVGHFVFAI